MKHYIILLYLLASFTGITHSYAQFNKPTINNNRIENPIVVVVCSYNNEKWSKATLDSIFNQEYHNFRVIIVDDCSSDNNAAVIQKYIDDNNLHNRITFIHNQQRHRKLYNLYKVLYDCDDEEIVVMVDGDDSLAHARVLEKINRMYEDKNIWFTYGQYRNVPASIALEYGHKEIGYCRPVPKHIQRKHAYRYYSFIYMHPRSFRAWLFKLVKLEDLIADQVTGFEGDFYPASNDVAMYFPMVEMAHTHIKFIPEILYIRNLYSDIVGFKVDRKIQTASAREIRKKKCYQVLFQEKKNRLESVKTVQTDIYLLCKNNLTGIEATLDNLQKQTTGLGYIYVFFANTPDNKKECRFIAKNLNNVIFIPCDEIGSKSFKNRLVDTISVNQNNYIALITDTSLIQENLNFSEAIYWLERTYGYRFYLNRTPQTKGTPRHICLNDTICAWKIPAKLDTWKSSIIGEDNFIAHKDILYQEIKSLNFNSINSLLKEIHLISTLPTRVGLFFKSEKMRPAP